jgi:type IV pilus assembly PilW-like protein
MRQESAPQFLKESGFTVIEMAVALFVTIELVFAALLLFDFSDRLARVQGNVTDMQQSLRISQYDTVRLVRMTGRGGLPVGTLTALPADANATATLFGAALAVRDNVPAGALIAGPGSPSVVEGTDVLTVRGAFSNPLYQVLPNATAFTVNPATGTGTVTIAATAPNNTTGVSGGIPQHLDALVQAVESNLPEALLMVSPINDSIFAVVELDPATSNVANPAVSITLGFKTKNGTRTAAYTALDPGGAFPAALTTVAEVAILEEYRIYVRSFQDATTPPRRFPPETPEETRGRLASDLRPKLSRARTFPNSDDPWGAGPVANNAANWSLDVADDVIDFQVALGFDTPQGGGSIAAGTATGIVDTADANDDWLFNSKADLPVDVATWNNSPLYYVRLNTLVKTDRPDPKYVAPQVVRVEDNPYTDASVTLTPYGFNFGNSLKFRRRLLQTVVDLRNSS